jgi:hydrogenase maturation factor
MPAPVLDATSGLLAFIRYGFMPNHLGYCGGNDQDVLFEHAVTGRAERGLAPLLAKFTGAVPYLRTIAAANGIADPFDRRVVDAYWLGNDLLDTVEASALSRSLEERFGRQLTGRLREEVLRKPPEGARPHHLFHVLDVYRRLEAKEIGMAAMENCRISWGRVRTVEPAALLVERQPLVEREGRLELGPVEVERVLRTLDGQGFTDNVAVGDWVSVHWGWACEVLDEARLAGLCRWSDHHLRLANQTL